MPLVAKQDLESFLNGFVLPLVQGGQCHVSDPLDFRDAQRFVEQLPHCSLQTEAIDESRKGVLARIVATPKDMLFEEKDLKLSLAVHNFLALVHPSARFSVKKKELVVGTIKRWLFSETKMDSKELQSRHGLLHGLLKLYREDTHLTWWTGKARFLGEEPPERLLRWGRLRRVKTEVSKQPIFGLLDEELLALYSLILTRTPLTLLLSTDEHPLVYSWGHLAPVLYDKQLSRAVMQGYTHDGSRMLQIPKRHGHAFKKLLLSGKDKSNLLAACQFLSMVLLRRLAFLKNAKPGDWKFEREAIVEIIEKSEDLKMVYGLPWAMKHQKSQGGLDWKHIANEDEHAIQDFYLEALEEIFDQDSLEHMSSVLDRALSAVVS